MDMSMDKRRLAAALEELSGAQDLLSTMRERLAFLASVMVAAPGLGTHPGMIAVMTELAVDAAACETHCDQVAGILQPGHPQEERTTTGVV